VTRFGKVRAARGCEHLWALVGVLRTSSFRTRHARFYKEAAMADAPAAEKSQRPIVPFLKLPAEGSPYLQGSRCKKCGTTYLGARMACSKCFSTDAMDDVKLSDKGEPDPKNLKFGMPVQMVTEKIRTDREGNDVIAFSFKPI